MRSLSDRRRPKDADPCCCPLMAQCALWSQQPRRVFMTTPENHPPAWIPPTNFPTQPSYPPSADPPPPRKKSALAKIGGIAGAILVALVVIAVKVGLGSTLGGDSAPKSPFAQTAAESYAHGADGIVLPTASAVPGFTTE